MIHKHSMLFYCLWIQKLSGSISPDSKIQISRDVWNLSRNLNGAVVRASGLIISWAELQPVLLFPTPWPFLPSTFLMPVDLRQSGVYESLCCLLVGSLLYAFKFKHLCSLLLTSFLPVFHLLKMGCSLSLSSAYVLFFHLLFLTDLYFIYSFTDNLG